MFGTSWKIGRVAGIDIRIDSSWLLIAVLVGYSFFLRFALVYDVTDGQAVLLAVPAALALFVSVLVHELAHSLVARARGIPVRGITLFLFGGATEARAESKSPGDELVIAAVGPATSVGLAGGLGLAAAGIGNLDSPVPGTVAYLAWVNVVLALFNLLPGLPLDGGRILRAVIWRTTGDMGRATRISSASGQALGWALVGVGVLSLLSGAGGLWLIVIGWFLAQAAQASYAQLRMRRLLHGVTADDVMTRRLVCIEGELPVDEAVERYFLRYDHSAFPVVDHGRVVGLLTLHDVRRMGPRKRSSSTVRESMHPIERLPTVPPSCPLERVVELFDEPGSRRLLVREDDGVVGIVSPSDVARSMQRSEELDRRERVLTPPG